MSGEEVNEKKKAIAVKKTTTSKAGAVSGRSHPKYSEMVKQALATLKERGGSSRQAVLKYVLQHFDVGKDETVVNRRLKVALRAGVQDGGLKQSKGAKGATGSFRLGDTQQQQQKKKNNKPAATSKLVNRKKATTKKATTAISKPAVKMTKASPAVKKQPVKEVASKATTKKTAAATSRVKLDKPKKVKVAKKTTTTKAPLKKTASVSRSSKPAAPAAVVKKTSSKKKA
jgi:histone H1/5